MTALDAKFDLILNTTVETGGNADFLNKLSEEYNGLQDQA